MALFNHNKDNIKYIYIVKSISLYDNTTNFYYNCSWDW